MHDFSTTVVSCFIQIYETEPYDFKTAEWRIEQFRKVARIGVPICLYGCSRTMPALLNLQTEFAANVKVFDIEEYDYTRGVIWRHCLSREYTLPPQRNIAKDTAKYMALMNSKIEFVAHSAKKNWWITPSFAWLDFSAAYMFDDDSYCDGDDDGDDDCSIRSLKRLCILGKERNHLYIPGCWTRNNRLTNNSATILQKICWRFCGTFFVGDAETILLFYKKYIYYLPLFLEMENTLVWETNFWAWLEYICGDVGDIKFCWYSANHDSSLFMRYFDVHNYNT